MNKNRTIGKYIIESELGKGAMGHVYKALDPAINRHVAIKILCEHASGNEEIITRFQREAQAAGRLNHPNIVTIYDYGEQDGQTYLVMELVEGMTLAELMRQQPSPFTLTDIVNISMAVLQALQYAHDKGVIHRDIKPSNILRTNEGEIKITDFGIARLDSSELTRMGTVMGTPGYMSPEQLLGQQIDKRSDLFSCGILLYELLTGEYAFAGNNATSIMYKVVHTELPAVSKLCPTVPAGFDAVIAKALAKSPQHRFVCADEFATAILGVDLQQNVSAGDTPADTVIDYRRVAGQHAAQDSQPATDTRYRVQTKAKKTDEAKPAQRNFLHRKIPALVLSLLAAAIVFMAFFLNRLWTTEPTTQTVETVQQPATSLRAGQQFKDCNACPSMVIVPPGSFIQGSPKSETGRQINEGPQHQVTLNYMLAVSRFEVTRGQFAVFIADTGLTLSGCATYEEGRWQLRNYRDWQAPGYSQHNSEPVTCVSWLDAQRYIDWLNDKTGKHYRLLSASEWEYIARGNNHAPTNWSANADNACKTTNVADISTRKLYPGWNIHNCEDGYIHTAPLSGLAPNKFGVYGMLGNVFEWVEDCWNDNYHGAPDDGSAWLQGDCSVREMRGGSWYSQPQYVRFAYRNHIDKETRASTFGIRLARDVNRG